MDYTTFDAEDFASNDRFIDWVNKKTPEADRFWATFIVEHPEKHGEIEKARALVISLRRAQETPHNPEQVDAMWLNIAKRVEASGKRSVEMGPLPRRNLVLRYSIAASLALILVSGVYWFLLPFGGAADSYSYFRDVNQPGFIEKLNDTGSPLNVQLEDGTVVTLENNSRLKYKPVYQTDSVREVYLIGEAFFEVVKSSKPFFVHANEVVTEVLGTSFRVTAGQRNVVVSVKTGKVSVYAQAESSSLPDARKHGVVLLPNQQVNYQRSRQSFQKELVEAPEIITPSAVKSRFMFENAPVREVFKTLQDAYGIDIVFNEEIMNHCFITAPLGSEPLFEKLQIICETIGADYDIVDAKIVIISRGC